MGDEPPFAPAAETWARTTWNRICTKCAVSLIAARASKNASKVPERLSRQKRFHTLPVPEFLRKSPPSDIMNHKIVQGFEKLSVIPALVAASRPRCREPQYNRPILFRHGREHGRSFKKTTAHESEKKVIWESLYPILG
jgi:hypothetical protein